MGEDSHTWEKCADIWRKDAEKLKAELTALRAERDRLRDYRAVLEKEIIKLTDERDLLQARWDEGPGKEICEARAAQARLLKENGELRIKVGELEKTGRPIIDNAKRIHDHADMLGVDPVFIYLFKEALNDK